MLLLLHATLLRAAAAVEMVVVTGRGKTPDSHCSPPRTAASLVVGVCVSPSCKLYSGGSGLPVEGRREAGT